jgi:hypothetical protein
MIKQKIKKDCRICKESFIPRSINGVYCSNKCRSTGLNKGIRAWQLANKKYIPLNEMTNVCGTCSCEFKPNKPRMVYCGYECRKIAELIRCRSYREQAKLRLAS